MPWWGWITIGAMLLVAEGIGQHFPRGYVYFAMVFAIALRTRETGPSGHGLELPEAETEATA